MSIIREVLFGRRPFLDLKASLPCLSAQVLKQRLSKLEALGIVQTSLLPPPELARAYGLTQSGYEAEPILLALAKWGTRFGNPDPLTEMSAASLMLSLRAGFKAERAIGRTLRVRFEIGDHRYTGLISSMGLEVKRASMDDPDLIIIGRAADIAKVIHEDASEALIRVQGEAAVFAFFRTLFSR